MKAFWEWLVNLFCSAKSEVGKLPGAGDAMQIEPVRPNKDVLGQKLLRYPAAIAVTKTMKTRGVYPQGYPEGCIVHFTSGWSKKGDTDAFNTVAQGVADGYCYFVISNEGRIFQAFPLDRWGYHAGPSSWPGLGTSVSTRLVGIEMCCGGDVKKLSDGNFRSWFGEIYKPEEVRVVSNPIGNVQKGAYHEYTDAQEKALSHLILWLKYNNPSVFNLDWVLGHDEVSPERKNDPGGSLSLPMSNFRQNLKDKYAANQKF